MPGRTLQIIAAVVAVATLSAAPAAAADGPDGSDAGSVVSSYLHTVEPSVIGPGDVLTLSGVVENTGDEPLSNVQALPRWSTVQLETRDEISQVSVDPTVRWGLRYDDPFQIVAERLDPGERREFELSVPADDMGFGLAGVYAVGVDLRGSLSNGERITLDTVRTIVPWVPGETPPPVEVALVWPVEATPSLLPDGALSDESLAARIADDGPLASIVDAASQAPVSWLVDPDVLDTVDAMEGGYETGTAQDDRQSGEAADRAAQWREEFNDAIRGERVLLAPYARPDVPALRAADAELATDIGRAAVQASVEHARDLPDARTGVTRADGAVDEEILALLADSGVRTVILPSAGVTPAPVHPLARVSTLNGDLDAVVTDTGLDAAIADAYSSSNPDAAALDLQQRWSAETVMVALDAAARGQEPAPMVASPPSRWTPQGEIAAAVVDAWTSPEWVTPTTIDDLRGPAQSPHLTVRPLDIANPLPAENIRAVGDLRQATHDYTELLAEIDSDLAADLDLATLRSASAGWRDDPAAGAEYASAITDELTGQLRDVRVTVPESITLSSRTGIFPLTVTNELEEPVTVRLTIEAANPDRLRVDDVEAQRVDAGSRETLEIRAEAATNGRVPITVQLVTNDGSPIGPPRQTIVHATDYGTIGWIIIAGAGALFGTAVVRTMLRRRSGGQTETEPTDTTTAANGAETPPSRTPEVAR